MLTEVIQPVSAAPLCARMQLIERLYKTTPARTLCAQEDKSDGHYRYGPLALENYLHIQVNPRSVVSWLVFDIDKTHAFSWQDNLLPPPNIIVSGQVTGAEKKEGATHIFYAIQNVTKSYKAKRKPIEYLQDIRKAMTLRLGADEDYTGPLCKNPLHPHWNTSFLHSHEYSLNELNEYLVTVKEARRQDFDWDAVPDSRNCTLFHSVRFTAYERISYARERWQLIDWEEHIYGLVAELNEFSDSDLSKTHPLSCTELRSIAKSIAHWTWFKYHPTHNRGIVGLWRLPIPIQNKALAQREGAKYTHRVRKASSKDKVREAIKRLKNRGERLTQQNIANESGLTRQTVAKYKSILAEC